MERKSIFFFDKVKAKLTCLKGHHYRVIWYSLAGILKLLNMELSLFSFFPIKDVIIVRHTSEEVNIQNVLIVIKFILFCPTGWSTKFNINNNAFFKQ